MANNNILLTSLDPDTLKSQSINWFQTQSVYRDYNFKGSNINVLLDILSRNTFLNSFFLNMAFSEGFLDSAQLRDSLISKSKELNYIPYSMKSSSTSLNLTFQTANLIFFEIPVGTIFQGKNSNGSFNFATNETYTQTSSNGYFSFSNVAIFEGGYKSDLFSVDTTINNQLFTLSSTNNDISSLSIVVSENAGSTNTVFTQAPNLYGISNTSNVYFLQAGSGNTYQFQFGDGVLGRLPQSGASVIATYRNTSGDVANYISQFTLVTNLGSFNGGSVINNTIASIAPSSGGSQAEGIDSIRYNAPRHYQTQGNAITAINYKNLIMENFPTVTDVNVYSGGITSTQVQYGVIFVALVTTNGNPATDTLKNNIKTFIQEQDILNYEVVFVDPTNLYICVDTNVHVDFDQTTTSASEYKAAVSNNILTFSNTNIEKYGTTFRYSKLTDSINNVDSNILSNETNITLKKFANVIINTENNFNVNFNNPISNVTSTSFIISGNTFYLSDNGNEGFIYLIQSNAANNNINPQITGSINYSTGLVTISNLMINNFGDSPGLAFVASPANKDIKAIGTDIISIDPLSINVNIVSD